MRWTDRGSNPDRKRDFQHPSRPALGATQSPLQWTPKSGREVKLTSPFHVVPRLRFSGANDPVPHTPSWPSQEQLIRYITKVRSTNLLIMKEVVQI
jgi:hypothetical protein